MYTSITRAISQFTFFGDGPSELKSMLDNVKEDACCLAEFYHLLWNLKEPGDDGEFDTKRRVGNGEESSSDDEKDDQMQK